MNVIRRNILGVATLLLVSWPLSAGAELVCEQRLHTGYTCLNAGISERRSVRDRLLNNRWYERFKAVTPRRDSGDIDSDFPRRPSIRRPSVGRPYIPRPYIPRPYIGRPSI